MRAFKISSTLINRAGVLSTLYSTLQQSVVASSTYFILEAIRYATAGQFEYACVYLSCFVISLILVFIPLSLSTIYLERWSLESFELFIRAFSTANLGRTTLAHAKVKTRFESWITNESSVVFQSATSTLYQIFSTFLNSTFNILVIAFSLDKRLLLWYLAAGVVLVLSNIFLKRLVSRSAVQMQQSRKDLSSVMLGGWDNILIGNRLNRENWLRQFSTCVYKSKATATAYNGLRSAISGATVSAAMLIIATGNAIYLIENKRNMVAVAALIITMPRQLQIVQSIFGLFNDYLSWLGCREQLQSLEDIIVFAGQVDNPAPYIQLGLIDIPGKGKDLETTIDNLAKLSSGRITVRGENGVGKSTLLALFAERTGDQSFFLPSKYNDLMFRQSNDHHSDGNRLLAAFNEIGELDDIKYIILDEWDANLDDKNITLISKAIDKLSKLKVVIESRHRRTE